jgi:hypothetical protein
VGAYEVIGRNLAGHAGQPFEFIGELERAMFRFVNIRSVIYAFVISLVSGFWCHAQDREALERALHDAMPQDAVCSQGPLGGQCVTTSRYGTYMLNLDFSGPECRHQAYSAMITDAYNKLDDMRPKMVNFFTQFLGISGDDLDSCFSTANPAGIITKDRRWRLVCYGANSIAACKNAAF